MSDVGAGAAPSPSAGRMLTALVRLRDALQRTTLPLELPGRRRVPSRPRRDDQAARRLRPARGWSRSRRPLLTVVGGSTGAGKSTLVNTLVGTRVSEPGVLRPTTRSPVLVHNPDDAHWFGPDRFLPDLVRTDHATDDQGTLQLVASSIDCRPVWPSSTRPTSTRSRSATGSSRPSCCPPPTCGCSSPRRRATPTRCPGTSSSRRPSGAQRSRSSSTAPRRPPSPRSAATSPGC